MSRGRRAIDDFTDNVFTDEIPFNSDITHLNIFIEDINDNAPVFEHPSEPVTHIGYPEADLASLLLPPYLIKVQASDADEGANAEIQYSINANGYFGIDAKTGIIFPMGNKLDSEILSLEVHASDVAHVTSTELKVHRLSLDHLIVVYVEDQGYHEIDNVLDRIHTPMGGNAFKILKYGNVPERTLQRSTSGTHLKIIAYAFDKNNQLILAGDLVE